MGKKVLFVATVDVHFRAFHLPTFRWFQDQGWEVHVAAQGELDLPHCDRRFRVPFTRQPLSLDNLRAYGQLKAILDSERYDLVHCHTPVGGALGRLAARAARRRGTKVLYTAHGFHFYTGAPLSHWLLYYPLERWLAGHTDTLITITREDHARAQAHRFPARRIAHVPGVGVDTERFRPLEPSLRAQRRAEAGWQPEDRLLIYAAEFNANKNQTLLIQALALIDDPRVHLLLAGEGPLQEACRALAVREGVAERVHFLGHRHDLHELLPLCDLAVASSHREGLPVNVLEAMACGLPIVATDNRGHRELVVQGETGALVAQRPAALATSLAGILGRSNYPDMGVRARKRVQNHFSAQAVQAVLTPLYAQKEPLHDHV